MKISEKSRSWSGPAGSAIIMGDPRFIHSLPFDAYRIRNSYFSGDQVFVLVSCVDLLSFV